MQVTIYHNPRCSKSRQTLALLEEHGVEPRIVEYLKTPPSEEEIRDILAMLGIGAADLLRTGEPEFGELGLGGADVTDEQRMKAMNSHPRLMQRPIVVCGTQARIGRPPEQVLEILA
jgi:arsenate reductase